MTSHTTAPSGVTIFYDADCGVCSWIALRALRAARAEDVRAIPIGSPEAEPRLGKLSHEDRWATWHVLGEDGRLRSGGAATAELLDHLPHGRTPARLVRAIPRTTERIYRLGASTRSLWGRVLPGRSVARARRELAVLTSHNQSERGARCRMIR